MTLVAKRVFNFAFYSNYNRSFWISFRTSRIKSCFYTQMWHLRKKYQVPTSMLYSHFAFVRFAVDDRWPAVMAGTINVIRENVWSGDKIHCFREIYFYLHFYHLKGDPPPSTVLIHWAEVCLQKKDRIYTNTGPYRQCQTSCQGNQWIMVYWFAVIFSLFNLSFIQFSVKLSISEEFKMILRYSVVFFFSSKRPFLFQFHV